MRCTRLLRTLRTYLLTHKFDRIIWIVLDVNDVKQNVRFHVSFAKYRLFCRQPSHSVWHAWTRIRWALSFSTCIKCVLRVRERHLPSEFLDVDTLLRFIKAFVTAHRL
jgi:hypothetical protein